MEDEIALLDERRRLGIRERLKLDGLPGWVHGVGLGGTLLVTLVLIGVFVAYKDVNVWENFKPAKEFIEPQYQETIHEHSVFRTRMNTWSNMGFVLVGFYLVGLAIHDARKKYSLLRGYVAHTPAQTFIFGIAGIYLGLGSGFFHASLSHIGQQCDVGGMYATMIVLAGICVGSFMPHVPRAKEKPAINTWPVIVAISVAASIYFFIYKWDYSFTKVSRPLTLLMIAFAIISLIQPRKSLQIGWFIAAIVTIITGAYIRQLDIEGTFSSPDAICQGHSVWHLMSALYFVFLYAYFRSEERGK